MQYLASLWPRLLRIYHLTFHPDLESALYLNRSRLNLACLTALGLDLLYALLWLWLFPHLQQSPAFLGLSTLCSALALLNLHYRFIPWVSQLAVVLITLWLNIPVLAFLIYLSIDPHVHALANTIILLLLYMHLQDWRSSLIGIFLASLLAPLVYFWGMGHWPVAPPFLQIFMLCTILGGVIVVALSSADLSAVRKQHAHKVLQVTQEQLRPALLLQSELVGNLRYEARNLLEDERQRLQLDQLAADIKVQVEHLGEEIARLVRSGGAGLGNWQTLGLLSTSHILHMVRSDLMAHYHFDALFLDHSLRPELQADVVIEANAAEISQALAALLELMLKASLALRDPSLHFRLRCWSQNHIGKLRIQARARHSSWRAPAPDSSVTLPAFTTYIFQLFHISAQVHAIFPDGSPADIELHCPLPSHSP